jgi:hypothetical protein
VGVRAGERVTGTGVACDEAKNAPPGVERGKTEIRDRRVFVRMEILVVFEYGRGG